MQTYSFQKLRFVPLTTNSPPPLLVLCSTCDDLLEQAKKDSRISYTILCTSHLMPTPLIHQGTELRENHKYITASYGMGVNYVSPNDVADAAMIILLDLKTHRNKVYNLCGPAPIRDCDVAKLLTHHYGTEIEHIELGYHDYKASVRQRGLPAWIVQDSAAFEKMKASGIDEESGMIVSHTEKIIGRKPESFKGYLSNKASMRPGATFP
jgi:NAD(P)H dehydrogenase (quinone)